jgi:hypothetical protein
LERPAPGRMLAEQRLLTSRRQYTHLRSRTGRTASRRRPCLEPGAPKGPSGRVVIVGASAASGRWRGRTQRSDRRHSGKRGLFSSRGWVFGGSLDDDGVEVGRVACKASHRKSELANFPVQIAPKEQRLGCRAATVIELPMGIQQTATSYLNTPSTQKFPLRRAAILPCCTSSSAGG